MATEPFNARGLSLALLLASCLAAPAVAQEPLPADTARITPRMPVPRIELRADLMDSMVARVRRQTVRRIEAITLYFPARRALLDPLVLDARDGRTPADTATGMPLGEGAGEAVEGLSTDAPGAAVVREEAEQRDTTSGAGADPLATAPLATDPQGGERPEYAFTLVQEAQFLDNQADRLRRRAADLEAEAARMRRAGEEQRAARVLEQGRLLGAQSRQLRAHAFRLRQRAQALETVNDR